MADWRLNEDKRSALRELSERGEELRQQQDHKYQISDFVAGAEITLARTKIFTALALMTFAVLAWQAHQFGATYPVKVWLLPPIGVVAALVPTVLLSLSVENALLRVLNPLVLMAGMLMATGAGYACWLGVQDSLFYWSGPASTTLVTPQLRQLASNSSAVSWGWLALPVLLIQGLVVLLAWRERAGSLPPGQSSSVHGD